MHQKKIFFLSYFLNDLCINGIDGITLLFFIATGLMSAGLSNKNIVSIGIVASTLISLILGISAYISLRAEKKHFLSLENRDILDAEDLKEKRLLENLGIGKQIQSLAREEIEKDRLLWQNLVTKLDDGQLVNRNAPACRGAVITGASYILGCLVPVIPYLFEIDSKTGLHYSCILSLMTLFILGYFKSVSLKTPLIGGAITSLFTGAIAGIGGFYIAKLFVQII